MPRVNPSPLVGQLVDAGARLLAEHGVDGLSLRQVAAQAGVSTMPVYTLFGDKRGLLAAMHGEGFRRLRAALDAVPVTTDRLADLMELGRAYRRAALASPNLYGLMFGPSVPGFDREATAAAAGDGAYEPLVESVRHAVAAGVLSGATPERIALHLWSAAHGMMSLELTGQLPPGDPATLYDEALIFAAAPFVAQP